MPRLLQRQEAPFEGRVTGRVLICIACGNRRTFWVRRNEEDLVVPTWEIRPRDKLVACGRCRSRNSVLLDASET